MTASTVHGTTSVQVRPLVLFVLYCAVHAVAPVALGAGFLFGLHLYGALSLAPALCLASGAILAHVPAYVVEMFGGPKEIAAARVYVGVYWGAVLGAAVLLAVAGSSEAATDASAARQLGNLAMIGILTALVAHMKGAAEVHAAPATGDPSSVTRARLSVMAGTRSRRADTMLGRGGRLFLDLSAATWALALASFPFLGAADDSYRLIAVLAVPTLIAWAGAHGARVLRTRLRY